MKAAYFKQKNSLEIIETDIPVLEAGEALVKVYYAGICGSDLHVYRGHHGTATYPRIPGHELIGELVDIKGTTKEGMQIGDTVVVQPYYSCGVCEPCITGHDNVCKSLSIFGIHCEGCFAEYVKVPIKKLYKIDKNIDLKLGALTEPLAVAVHDVRKGGVKAGDNVLICGGGPIGMLIAIVAKANGAHVYLSEVNEFRLNVAKDLGFSIINPMNNKITDYAKEVGGGKGFDVVFETSGSKVVIEEVVNTVKICGTLVIVGVAKEVCPFNTNGIYQKELNVVGVRIHSQQSFEGAINLLESGIINSQLEKLIDPKIFPLDDIESAFEYCEKDLNHFKTLVKVF